MCENDVQEETYGKKDLTHIQECHKQQLRIIIS